MLFFLLLGVPALASTVSLLEVALPTASMNESGAGANRCCWLRNLLPCRHSLDPFLSAT